MDETTYLPNEYCKCRLVHAFHEHAALSFSSGNGLYLTITVVGRWSVLSVCECVLSSVFECVRMWIGTTLTLVLSLKAFTHCITVNELLHNRHKYRIANIVDVSILEREWMNDGRKSEHTGKESKGNGLRGNGRQAERLVRGREIGGNWFFFLKN